ncbi:MAG: hypothetical protein LIP12_14185 [Clostridiales bacterium]|nr:hypothetical protein [Clostridiales bacterium]
MINYEKKIVSHNAPESCDSGTNLSGENPQARVSASLRSALNGHPLDVQRPSDKLNSEKQKATVMNRLFESYLWKQQRLLFCKGVTTFRFRIL